MLVSCLSLLVGYVRVCGFFIFPSNLPGGSLLVARFGGIGVGILLETCYLSADERVDTSSVVCVRISLTSTKWSRNDWWALGLDFVNITWLLKSAHWRRWKKNFLRPFYSFTDEGVIGMVLVSCINTMHMCIGYYEFRFLLCDSNTSTCVIYHRRYFHHFWHRTEETIQNNMNKRHENLEFKMTIEGNSSTDYLDLMIMRHISQLETDTFRKPTTSTTIHTQSSHPIEHKIAAYTRWFKYDWDKLWLVYTQIVPVIFVYTTCTAYTTCTYLKTKRKKR
jgi:hypothetical protein